MYVTSIVIITIIAVISAGDDGLRLSYNSVVQDVTSCFSIISYYMSSLDCTI